MKKILEWIREVASSESAESKRKTEMNEYITRQQAHLLKMKGYTKEQRLIFCDGMDYAAQMQKMMRLMNPDELRDYLNNRSSG